MEPREYMQELRDCADQVTFDGDKEAWIVALCNGDLSHSDIMGLVHQRDEARKWARRMKAERDMYRADIKLIEENNDYWFKRACQYWQEIQQAIKERDAALEREHVLLVRLTAITKLDEVRERLSKC